jgi:NAD(P)-dependent dehydrogenase (short-subunit alcohol dehydrogenase family)
MSRHVALVTGASRGIGKAAAIHLAGKGYDVAVTARTMIDGEGRSDQTGIALPGGLDTTVAGITDAGGAGLAVRMDVLDRQSLLDGVGEVIDHFGRVDLLLNNAIYQGKGAMVPFMELDEADLETMMIGNVYAQLALIKAVLPSMIQHGGGTIMNMISPTAYYDPPGKIGEGGWGMGYAMTKAAFERVAPLLEVEHRDEGIKAFSVEPGHVPTEKSMAEAAARGTDHGHGKHFRAATPDVIGAAIAWLATTDEDDEYRGKIVHLQREAKKRGLVADWPE